MSRFAWDNAWTDPPKTPIKIYLDREWVASLGGFLFSHGMAFPEMDVTEQRASYTDPLFNQMVNSTASQIARMLDVDLRQKPTDNCIIQQMQLDGTWIDVFDFSTCLTESVTDVLNLSIEYNNRAITFNSQTNHAGDVYNNYTENYIDSAGDVFPDLLYGDADDSIRNSALCQALKDYVQVICDTSIDTINKMAQVEQEQRLGIALAGLAIALVTFATAGVATGILYAVGVAGGIAGTALTLTTSVGYAVYNVLIGKQIENFSDDIAKQMIVCAMYDNLNTIDLTLETLQGSLVGYLNDPTNDNDNALRDVVHEYNQLPQSHAMFLERFNYWFQTAKVGIPLTGDCENCDADFCQDFDFLTGTHGWEIYEGSWLEGEGFLPEQDTTGDPVQRQTRAFIHHHIDVTAITLMRLYFHATVNRNTAPFPVATVIEGDNEGLEGFGMGETAESRSEGYYIEWTGNKLATNFYARVGCGSKAGGGGYSPPTDAGDCRLVGIRIAGNGANPFTTGESCL